MKSSTSRGSTGMMIPIANMSSMTVTKTNANAARRGPWVVGSVMGAQPAAFSRQCDVVAVADTPCGELGRGEAGQRPALANEVRLIEVAAILRHVCPVAAVRLQHAVQRALESLDAGIDLRRQTDFQREQSRETARAQSDVLAERRNRAVVWLCAETSDRE